MSIDLAEQLKSELTDKYVVVDGSVPELKRFANFTGQVKTVNMNGQALVQFDTPEDISWYDINPTFLSVVDAPKPKEKAAPAKAKAAAPKKAAAKSTAGMSPLEAARAQGAGGGAKAKPASAKSTGGMSALEQARAQGAGGSKPAAAKPAAASSDKKLSPLELARQQGAVGAGGAKPKAAPAPKAEANPEPVHEVAETTEAVAPEPAAAPAEPTPVAKAAAPAGGQLSTDEILDLCRSQGPFKG